MKTKTALHIKDVQLFLDECIKTHEKVSVTAMKQDGSLVSYDGWQVCSSHWRAGTHDLQNPKNPKAVRKIRDVLIFNVNGHPVYI